MAQSPLNGITQPVEIEEKGQNLTGQTVVEVKKVMGFSWG